MKKLRNIPTSLAFQILGGIVCLLMVYSLIIQTIGYLQFTDSLTAEYNDSAFRTAETAATLVNGDKIDEYLATGGDSDEYRDRLNRMDILCQKQNVTLIYVIKVDTSDYGRFQSVFNTVSRDSHYDPWPVGYRRDTTNEEYERIYRDIYENGLEQGTVIRTSDLRGNEAHITSLVPIKGSDGEVKAILCVQRPMEELVTGRIRYMRSVGFASILLTVIACCSAAGFLKHNFVTPVERIISEAKRFAKENTAPEGEAFRDTGSIKEIRELAASVEKMENDTMLYMENLMHATAERQRIDTELTLARSIQANMLPNVFPPFPSRGEFDIYASMTPAKEVGGDFYDFFLLDEDHLGLVMADVSGKGVPAALFMMMVKIMLQNYAMAGGSPAEVIERLNNAICKNNEDDLFVTVWFGIYSISEGRILAVNAGHECPVIKRREGKFELMKDSHDFVVGGIEGMSYRNYEFSLDHGDALFLYTDGIPDALNVEGKAYGIEGLISALNESPDASAHDLLHKVAANVAGFVGEADMFDDLTMLGFRRT